MTLLLIMCVLMAPQSSAGDVRDIVVKGSVTDDESNPLIGAVVAVPGTPCGAMTDANGNYLFHLQTSDDLLTLETASIGMTREIREVSISSGDTIRVDFSLLEEGSYVPSLSSMERPLNLPDTVTVTVKNWRELDMSRVQVWRVPRTVYPSWLVNDSTIAAALQENTGSVRLWIYPGQGVNLNLEHGESFLETRIPVQDEGLFANGSSTTLIDLRRWGNADLQNHGFLGSEIYGENRHSSRILIAYNEQAVVIDQLSDTTIIEYPFPTFYYRTDPTLSYLLIWEISGAFNMSGNAALISLDSGECTVFDPTPDVQESSRVSSYSTEFMMTDDTMNPVNQFHVSTSGEVFWLNDRTSSSFRHYDRHGNLLTEIFTDQLFPERFTYQAQFFNDEDRELSVILRCGGTHNILKLNSEGRVILCQEIQTGAGNNTFPNRNPHDPESGFAWNAKWGGGLVRFDLESGKAELMESSVVRNVEGSPGFVYAAADNIGEDHVQIVILDWNTMEEVSSFTLAGGQNSCPILHAVGDRGHCLLSRPGESGALTFFLTDMNGCFQWKQPGLPPYFEYHHSFLEDGTVFFGTGMFLVVHTPEGRTAQ